MGRTMMKSYYDFMSEITADELYEGLLGYGLFAEKLPPIFSASLFLDYCKTNPGFKREYQDFITFNSMRNLNIPRLMGIPSPFQYEGLCSVLSKNWHWLLQHFKTYTAGQSYVVSRIHIRKMYDSDSQVAKHELFEMNYKNWRNDGSPENELLITDMKASKYIVHADISTCFPSIYSHALPWALVGKDTAKANRTGTKWYNKIDKACRHVKNDETHGLLIGPHASNLLAEIILVVVDKNLWDQGFRFFRNIDDYDCYVKTYEEAQLFLNALEYELRQFDLPINHKKTKIETLPVSSTEHWIHKLNAVPLVASYGKTSYKEVNNYIDMAVRLTDQIKNAAVLKYGIKTLSGLENMTPNGKAVAAKRIMHLSILYPYLLPLMENFVFEKYGVNVTMVEEFTNALYIDSLRIRNYEGICYAIYFSLRYQFSIVGIDCCTLLATSDCLVLLFAWLYYRKHGGIVEMNMMENEAKKLRDSSMGRYWVFVYEVLEANDLKDDWKTMKNKGISFIKSGI